MFPREFSQRAAQAARVFIPMALLAGLAGCSAEPPPPLPAITVETALPVQADTTYSVMPDPQSVRAFARG